MWTICAITQMAPLLKQGMIRQRGNWLPSKHLLQLVEVSRRSFVAEGNRLEQQNVQYDDRELRAQRFVKSSKVALNEWERSRWNTSRTGQAHAHRPLVSDLTALGEICSHFTRIVHPSGQVRAAISGKDRFVDHGCAASTSWKSSTSLRTTQNVPVVQKSRQLGWNDSAVGVGIVSRPSVVEQDCLD